MFKHGEKPFVKQDYAKKWVEKNGPIAGDVSASTEIQWESGLASCLYLACRNVFKVLCRSSHSDLAESEMLKQQLGRFHLWGESYIDGSLDNALSQSDEIRDIVLILLCDIARELLHRVFLCYSRSSDSIEVVGMSKLSLLVEKARALTDLSSSRKGDDSDEEKTINGSTISNSDSSVSESEGDQRARSNKHLTAFVQGLMDLGPAIETNLVEFEQKQKVTKQPTLLEFNVSGPAHTYVSVVRDKYPQAPTRLAERLGEANWQRHVFVRKMMHGEESLSIAEQAQEKPVSLFHDSGIGTTLGAGSQYAATASSFNSSIAEKEHGSLRVPPTPKDVIRGQSFRCFLCQVVQRKIKNRIDWKKHVYADLKPYICPHPGCHDELLRFPTREAWAQHFDKHLDGFTWKCTECDQEYTTLDKWKNHLQHDHERTLSAHEVEYALATPPRRQSNTIEHKICPLCLECPSMNRKKFVRHVCRHMEDIALMVLPRDLEKEDDQEEDSDDGLRATSDTVASSLKFPQTQEILVAQGSSLYSDSIGHTSDTDRSLKGSNVISNIIDQEPEKDPPRSLHRRRKSAPSTAKEMHQCLECNKAFKRPCDLTKHEKTHSRPWKCSEKSCKYHDYGWPTEKERDRHINDKHSLNPTMYKCHFQPCPYESKRESNCKQHMEKAHGWNFIRPKANGKRPIPGRPVSLYSKNSASEDEAIGLSAPPATPAIAAYDSGDYGPLLYDFTDAGGASSTYDDQIPPSLISGQHPSAPLPSPSQSSFKRPQPATYASQSPPYSPLPEEAGYGDAERRRESLRQYQAKLLRQEQERIHQKTRQEQEIEERPSQSNQVQDVL